MFSLYTCSSKLPSTLGSVPISGVFHMPTCDRTPTRVNVDTKGSKSLPPIIRQLLLPDDILLHVPACSLAFLPVHPSFPLLSIRSVDTIYLCHSPNILPISGFNPNPGPGYSEHASTVKSAFLSPAPHEGLIWGAADPNLFPEDTVQFLYFCLSFCPSVQCPQPTDCFFTC